MNFESLNFKKAENEHKNSFESKDEELLSNLQEISINQFEAMRQDREIRDTFILDTVDVQDITESCIKSKKILEEAKLRAGSYKPMSEDLFTTSEHEKKENLRILRGRFSRMVSQEYQDLASELENQELLYDFVDRASSIIDSKCKDFSRQELEKLMINNEQLSDKIFTTSQEGATGSSSNMGNDGESIYYMFKLSNGSYISQRFKRNLLEQGLKSVIQPFASLTLFVSDKSGIDGYDIEPGVYSKKDLSIEPQLESRLFDYFEGGDSKYNPINLDMPEIAIDLGGQTEIKQQVGLGKAFPDAHGGTIVNDILK
jgi:hypothetical protein